MYRKHGEERKPWKMHSAVETSAHVCGAIRTCALCWPFLCPLPLSPFTVCLSSSLDHNNIWLKELHLIIVFRRYFTRTRILNYAFIYFHSLKLLFYLLISMCWDRDFADLITFAPQDMRAFIPSASGFNVFFFPYHSLEQFSAHVLIISGFLSTSTVLRLLSFLYRRAYAFH